MSLDSRNRRGEAGQAKIDTEPVCALAVLMNLTISVDDRTLERARALARKRGVSLQQLLRQYLESLAGSQTTDDTADQLLALLTDFAGHSGGKRFTRDEAYDGRV